MRIVNTSKKPFEFMFNATSFGPYAPGEIADLPDAVAMHGIKRSVILDEEGNYIGQHMEFLNDIKVDPERLRSLIVYDCPLAESEQCNAKGFSSLDDLRAHMEHVHWGKPESDDPLAPASTPKTKPSSKP